MISFWQCPYCNDHSTVTNINITEGDFSFDDKNKYGKLVLKIKSITCPNPSCREFVLQTALHELTRTDPRYVYGKRLDSWKLRPQSSAKPLPDYIPKAIKEDYEESCLIKTLSPKSSATLARRCLQGILRDFWKVKPQNLAKEIDAIKEQVDPDIWEAIDVIRKVGKIGAHMEKDINQIIEVDEDEAELLIGLIETLIEEWYINRYKRQQRLADIKQLGQDKEDEKEKIRKGGTNTPN